ncbi:MAG: hypothetical protein WBF77_03680 [Sulfurimonadaceae bacterium]
MITPITYNSVNQLTSESVANDQLAQQGTTTFTYIREFTKTSKR